ncbi:MAG: thermonuclease family protein [Candidatus Micrarchaeia archaeon]
MIKIRWQHGVAIAIFIIAAILVVDYLFGVTSQKVLVYNVIDGDTFEDNAGNKYRLVGINTPEKGELCYEEAKNFLTSLIWGKEVSVIIYGKEKYGRALAEVYYNGKNVNHAMLANGFANVYYGREEGINWKRYFEAESMGRDIPGCMWKASLYKECIFGKWDNGGFTIENLCDINVDTEITIRDTSASHRFKRNLRLAPKEIVRIEENCCDEKENAGKICLCQHIFNTGGDELIIYDKDGLLVFVPYGVYLEES